MVPLIFWAQPASAHDIRPGTLTLSETAPASYVVSSTPAQDGGKAVRLLPTWPADCTTTGERLTCTKPLDGPFVLYGPRGRQVKVVAVRHDLDGSHHLRVLHEGDHIVRFGAPHATELMGLGGAHVITGWDHLAFIMGLVLLCGRARALMLAITGFTVGHTAALLLASAGALMPSRTVEVWVALSIVWVAREAMGDANTLTRRRPALVSSLLGLVHGLGFAGIIDTLELEPAARTTGLLQFNLGVELVQLLLVLPLALVLHRLPGRTRRRLAFVLGGLGMYWLFQRLSGG
ncbi:MAG TPA: hypothetical protein DFR83_14875 [Deltaproteobacteria bacterium]|nr:hypothetical protein [Deltaproteobacteria bacterium]